MTDNETTVDLHIPTSRDYPQHELEHAVALERERICQWIERVAPHLKIYLVATGEDTGQTKNMVMADAIRSGEHWRAI